VESGSTGKIPYLNEDLKMEVLMQKTKTEKILSSFYGIAPAIFSYYSV
jgi:hypothetical protein